MALKRLWVHCSICKEQVMLIFNDEFQKEFHAKAKYFPYPIIVPHREHYLLVYLDKHLDDRGVVTTEIELSLDEINDKTS